MQEIVFNTEAFNKKYKGTRKFSESSKYYQLFLRSLHDEKLYEHIVFCNDVLQIPPIYVFVKYYADECAGVMSDSDKRGLGACFGYLFQFTEYYAYKTAKHVWVGDARTGIKNASYFVK